MSFIPPFQGSGGRRRNGPGPRALPWAVLYRPFGAFRIYSIRVLPAAHARKMTVPDETDLLAQLVEEFTTRLRQGELPEIERDYAARYPQLAERIRALFPTLMLLEGMAQGGPVATPPAMPAPLAPQAEFGA